MKPKNKKDILWTWRNYAWIYDENDPIFQNLRRGMDIHFYQKKVKEWDEEYQKYIAYKKLFPRSWISRWIRRLYYKIFYRKDYYGIGKK